MPDAYYHGLRRDLIEFLPELVDMITGKVPDRFGIGRNFSVRLGNSVLESIQKDFRTKSQGGMGEDGIRWPPLSEETIRRRQGSQKKPKTDPSKSFHQLVARYLQAGRSRTEAMEMAQRALYYAPPSSVPILHETGEHYRSLTPSVGEIIGAMPGQIFEVEPGRLKIGTNEKPWHHYGSAKLPARSLWPLDENLPASWWQRGLDEATAGLARDVATVLENRRI